MSLWKRAVELFLALILFGYYLSRTVARTKRENNISVEDRSGRVMSSTATIRAGEVSIKTDDGSLLVVVVGIMAFTWHYY